MNDKATNSNPNKRIIWVRLFNRKGGGDPIGRAQEGSVGKIVFIEDVHKISASVGHFLKVEVLEERPTAINAIPYHFYTEVPENTRTRVVHPEKIEEGHSFQASHITHAEKLFTDKLTTLRAQHESKPKVITSPNRSRRIRAFTDSSGRVHVTY